jgi:hypothetical protein
MMIEQVIVIWLSIDRGKNVRQDLSSFSMMKKGKMLDSLNGFNSDDTFSAR